MIKTVHLDQEYTNVHENDMKAQVTHLNLLQLLRLRNFKQEIILQASEKTLLQYFIHML